MTTTDRDAWRVADKRRLQQAVDQAFQEPEYVDTGDLINALREALAALETYGDMTITVPTHYDDEDES